MSNVLRLIPLAALLWAGFYLLGQARMEYGREDADGTRIMLLYAGLMLVAVCTGILFVLTYLPRIGEAVGNFFFNPSTAIEESPHTPALAAVARGDYRKAIAEYEKVLAQDPGDTVAIGEIAHLHSEKLHDPQRGAEILQQALYRDLPPHARTALAVRLAEICWKHLHDPAQARAALLRVVEEYPGTRHAMTAQHRLHELEKEVAGLG